MTTANEQDDISKYAHTCLYLREESVAVIVALLWKLPLPLLLSTVTATDQLISKLGCCCCCHCCVPLLLPSHHAAAAAAAVAFTNVALPLLYALCAVRCVAHCLLPHAVAFQNWRRSALLLIEQNWHHRSHFLVITAHALHATQDVAHCQSLPTAWLPVTVHRLQNFRCCWLIYRIASRSADCTQNESNFNFSLSHGATWIPIKVLDSRNHCSTWSRPKFMM